jgi:cyclase
VGFCAATGHNPETKSAHLNVERAYREFRNEPADAPWDKPATFDAINTLAQAKGIEVEF